MQLYVSALPFLGLEMATEKAKSLIFLCSLGCMFLALTYANAKDKGVTFPHHRYCGFLGRLSLISLARWVLGFGQRAQHILPVVSMKKVFWRQGEEAWAAPRQDFIIMVDKERKIKVLQISEGGSKGALVMVLNFMRKPRTGGCLMADGV